MGARENALFVKTFWNSDLEPLSHTVGIGAGLIGALRRACCVSVERGAEVLTSGFSDGLPGGAKGVAIFESRDPALATDALNLRFPGVPAAMFKRDETVDVSK